MMTRIDPTFDYYAFLGVPSKATVDEIKKSFRSRARDLHPDKNRNNPNATADFQRLGEAYETLKDPGLRREYDIKWPRINTKQRDEQDGEKGSKDVAEASRKQAAEEAVKKQKEAEDIQNRLKRWILERNHYQSEIFEGNRRIRRLTAEIARLQAVDDDEVRKEKERNSWWTYLSSPIYGKVVESEEEKRNREVERLQRVASKSIKKNELTQEETKLKRWEDLLKNANDQIDAEYKKQDDERREADSKRREAEAKKRAEFERQQAEARRAERERLYAEMRKRQEEADRIAREERERQEKEAEEAYKKLMREIEEERARREDQERKRRQEDAKLARQGKARTRYSTVHDLPSASTRMGSCRHNIFWPKINGAQACNQCHQLQPKFVFQCSICKIKACANCRQSLKGEKQWSSKGKGKQKSSKFK